MVRMATAPQHKQLDQQFQEIWQAIDSYSRKGESAESNTTPTPTVVSGILEVGLAQLRLKDTPTGNMVTRNYNEYDIKMISGFLSEIGRLIAKLGVYEH